MMALTNQFFTVYKPILPHEQPPPPEDNPNGNDASSLKEIDITNDRYSKLSSMILWLDANQNAGFNTFDPQATSWKNLAVREDKLPDMSFYTKDNSTLISSYNSENFTWGNVTKESNDCKCLSVADSGKVFGSCVPNETLGYTRSKFIDLLNNCIEGAPNKTEYTIDFSIRVKNSSSNASPVSILASNSNSKDTPFFNLNFKRDDTSNQYGELTFKDSTAYITNSLINADNYIYVAIIPNAVSAYGNDFRMFVASDIISNSDTKFPLNVSPIDSNIPSYTINTNDQIGIFLNKLIANPSSVINWCSLRMYDVALTDLQIARNFKLDLTKYDLPFLSKSTAETNKPNVN